MGPSWSHFGLARSPHERCWRLLGSMLPLVITLEPSWGHLGANTTKFLFNSYSLSFQFLVNFYFMSTCGRRTWGGFGAILGPSWGHLWPSWKRRSDSAKIARRLGESAFFEGWGGNLGAILGQPWAILGQLEGIIGDVGGISGLSCILEPSWGHLRTILGPSNFETRNTCVTLVCACACTGAKGYI